MTRLPDISLDPRPTPRPSKAIAQIRPRTGFEDIPAQVQAQVGADFQRLGQQIFAAKERHDTLVAEDAYNQFRAGMMELELGENGFGNVHGAKAFDEGFREDYGSRLTKQKEEIGKDLNDNQTAMFERRTAIGTMGFDERLIRHSATESMAFAKRTADGSKELALLGITAHGIDEFKVDVANSLNNVDLAGEQRGLPPELIEAEKQQFVDAAFATLIQTALDGNQVVLAQANFKLASDGVTVGNKKIQMSASALATQRDILQEEGDFKLAQTSANLWLVEGLTLSEGQSRARDIKDSHLQKVTKEQWNNTYRENEIAEDEVKLDTFEGYAPKIENGEIAYQGIPRAQRDLMTAGQRSTLRKLEAERVVGGPPKSSDFDTYTQLNDLIAEDRLLEARKLLANSLPKLKESDRTFYSKAVAKGLEDPEVKSFFTRKERLDQKTSGLGIGDTKRFELEGALDEWYVAFQIPDGKKPDANEINTAIDDLLVLKGGEDYVPFNEEFMFEEENAGQRLIWESIVESYKNRHGRLPSDIESGKLLKHARKVGMMKSE